jgi:feruloyl esterase
VCIVTGKIAGRIGFELRLPDAWNGRYYQIGTGGFSGKIFPEALAWDAAKGNAVAMSDAGHQADSMDARWAKDNPQAVIDYGYRAIKLTRDTAQALIQRYYGRAATHRYFAGCSNGGRQALMAAMRWPQDWDGIVAGAPAALWTRQFAIFASLQQQVERAPAVDPAQVQRDALASCPKGSVANGVALDPERCRYRPRDPLIRAIVTAGYEPTATGDWPNWIINPDRNAPSQRRFAEGAFRYILRDQPEWQIADYDSRTDRPDAEAINTLDATRSLAAFRAKGGKIISYFGWGDAVLASHPYAAWYDARGAHRRNWFRLFMVPGMDHCQGGGVPDAFGQSPASPAGQPDAQHDIRRAIEAWVERGTAPARLIASGAGRTQILRPR